VNNLGTYGRWAFAEFTDVWDIAAAFNEMINAATTPPPLNNHEH
jgi:type III restriction enzyme